MTDLANAVAQLEAERNELKSRLSACEQQLAYQVGRCEQAEAHNAKLQATIVTREMSLTAYQLGDKISALDPIPRPAPPEPQRLAPPPAHTNGMPTDPYIDEPMPSFIRTATIPKVQDRRRSA